MSLFFETVKVENGKIFNLKEHNLRLNKTIKDIYKKRDSIDISKYIEIPDNSSYRYKIIYSSKIEDVSYQIYRAKEFNSFRFIKSDIIYPYKSVNREKIDNLFQKRDGCDDIILVKDGLVQDTSIANIAIYDGKKWYTPKKPLLCGTQRAKLLKSGLIIEKDLRVEDFKNIVSFAIMNSLIGFREIKDAKLHF